MFIKEAKYKRGFQIFKIFYFVDRFLNSFQSLKWIPENMYFKIFSIGFRIATHLKTGISQRYF